MSIQSNTIELQSILEQANALPDAFTPPESEVLTPEFVYKTTRPKDWLPMPRPGDNEMYLLGYLEEGFDNQVSFVIYGSGSLSVEIGTIRNKEFVPIETVEAAFSTRFTKKLDFYNYGDQTAEGYRQYVVKITSSDLVEINIKPEANNSLPNNIVDIVCGANTTIFAGTTSDVIMSQAVTSLRYVRYTGTGINRTASLCFSNCRALRSISAETKKVTAGNSDYAFINCVNLLAISPSVIGMGQSLNFTFQRVPISRVKFYGKPTSCYYAFCDASLEKLCGEDIDTSLTSDMRNMFTDARLLISVTDFNITSLANPSNMFQRTFSLRRLTFSGETTPGGWTINLTHTRLDHDALVEMIASLPVATATATITITGLPGASELTDAEIAVATAKNWTITR